MSDKEKNIEETTDLNKEIEEKEKVAEQDSDEEVVTDLNEPDPQEEISRLNKEIERLKNEYAKAYADTQNMQRRLKSEHEQYMKYHLQSFATSILPAIDNLERALAQEETEENKGYRQGVKMIYDQIINALKNEGVEEIDCQGKEFDARYMQGIMLEKVEGKEPNMVIEVLQKGYMLKDRILRPAMVKVSE